MADNIFILIAVLIPFTTASIPQWTNLNHTISLNEDTAPTTSIYRIDATDADGDTLTYSLVSTQFSLSGQDVQTVISFDYEVGPRTYNIIFSVTDGNTTIQGTLTIIIANVNEFTPALSSASITGSIEEEKPIGTTVTLSFTASDNDTDSVLQYSLSGTHASYFSILSSTGRISTASVFDRDSLTAIKTFSDLFLTVSDGSRSSSATVTISLIDINDNPPVFVSTFYTGSVTENSNTGTSVAKILATDADDGVNKVFNYAISSGDPSARFSISGNDLVTTSVAIDYETDTTFTLVITATDTGSPALTGTTTVKISVTSVNEFSPEWSIFTPAWTSATTEYSLLENAGIGTTVVTIRANDNDAGNDGKVKYELGTIATNSGRGDTSGLFRLDSVTGVLSTVNLFDSENVDNISCYDIIVIAKDSGATVKTVDRTVRVGLTDINDNEPKFASSSYTITKLETTPIGTSIIEFIVTDADATHTFTYEIASGDTVGYFEFNPTFNNILQLKSVIDLDSPISASSIYNLQVTVKDGGSPELTGTTFVTVSVTAVNEYTPMCTSNVTNETVAESTSIGQTIATVSASDKDYGHDGEVEYSIASGNTNSTFRIDSQSGKLVLIKELDYETTQSYLLKIQAKDKGTPAQVATCTVSITVFGVNDNEPSCSSISTLSVLETAAIGYTVTNLSCIDADSGTILTYSLSNSQFAIDTLGVITLAAALDYDSSTQSYSFEVTVSDGLFSTTVGLVVAVTAINEYTPTFTNVNLTVAENFTVGTILTTFTATDRDYYPHNIVSYTILSVSNSGGNMFTIDSESAEVKLSKLLDYDAINSKYYEITVVATDGGGRQGSGIVNVSITDVNDNGPSCQQSLYVLSIAENTHPTEIISDLMCSDKDSGKNSELTYFLSQTPGSEFSLTSGSIVSINLTGSLNYENVTSYTLVVSVNDGGSPALSTTISIYIDVTDANDGGPSFNEYPGVTVSENVTVGTVILSVTANDPDNSDSPFGKQLYSIVSGDIDNKFTIDLSTGQVTVNKQLDRETKNNYLLIVQAMEEARTYSASTTVNLSISDVNDNKPFCTIMTFSIVILESTTVGTALQTLNCSDRDSALFGTLSYTLLTGDTGTFEVSYNHLNLKSSVDFESGPKSYNIVINVSDGLYSVNITGTISIADVNEASPMFSSGTYNVNMLENSTIGTTVVTLVATDADTSDVLFYSITSTTTYFSIDSVSGTILLSKQLDREILDNYSIDVTVSDGIKSNTSTVKVTVVDINDNSPLFNPTVYRGSVSENDVVGASVILTVTATDADDISTEANGRITFSIIDGDLNNDFKVNSSTGELTTLKQLDFEKRQSFSLVIKAADRSGDGQSLSATAFVTVTVTSVNEFDPVFHGNNSKTISEDTAIGTSIITLNATDLDSGVDGVIYFKCSNTKFYIGSDTGVLYLKDYLDYEKTTSYFIEVIAYDRGIPARSLATNVSLLITDVNDNVPMCPQSFYSAPAPENSTDGYKLLQIVCSDSDATSTVFYYLISPVSEFQMNETSGILAVYNGTLDAEFIDSFTILVNVTDKTYSTTVTIQVSVDDINEYTPEFTPSGPYSVTIPEDFQTAGIIFSIRATDKDHSNVSLTYSIKNGVADSYITINSETGLVQLRKALDAEFVDSFFLIIDVTDGVYNSETNLNISIADVNDNYPSCDQNAYSVSFHENLTVGSIISVPVCSDIDISNSALLFTITAGNEEDKFEIGNSSGVLFLNNSLDYESTTQYALTVSVADNGTPTRSINYKVYVTVLPINEQAPVFSSKNYGVNVSEDLTLNSRIVLANATDSDRGLLHGAIKYTIISGDPSGHFFIDTFGQIRLSRALDREAIDFYNLTVEAYDDTFRSPDSLTSTALVSITVYDINDNYPKFSQNTYYVSVYENSVVGATILVLNASDDDINENGVSGFSFSIVSGNNGNTFNISENKIILASNVDRETSSYYKLKLQVRDNGTTPLTDNAYLNVEVLAVNEYFPKFTNGSNQITVSETVPIGTILHIFAASDMDTGDYGRLRYYISGNNSYNEFLLDEYTGQFIVWSVLDYDMPPAEYNITVQAIDTGYNNSDSKSDYMWLLITLTDENDHTPAFSQNVYTLTTYENVTSGYVVGSVTASDADSGNNGIFMFSIVSGDGSSVFSVNQTTGEIATVVNIDYESKQIYSVVVEVKDNGSSSLSSRCLVKILINDLNDNAPEFQPEDFAINLPENATVGSSVTVMYAVDKDSSVLNNNVFTYSVDSNTFVIDANRGIISTKAKLDRENISSYTLNVLAIDMGIPAMTGTATLTILLDDVNDNAPIIYGNYQITVSEIAIINTVIVTLNATDHDDGVNGELTFVIVNGNTDNDFKIEASLGLLQVNNTLDRERTVSYNLSIDVTDGGSPSNSNSINVTILVSDINDNGPTFTSSVFTFSIPENLPVGSIVGTVTATDPDSDNNGKVSYYLPVFWSGLNSHFRINESSGVIFTNSALDRETYDSYTILCKITDNGAPKFTNTVNITITVTDINDYDPLFNSTSYSASFPENQANGSTLIYVFLTDQDIGVNKDITLTIDNTTINGQIANSYIDIDSARMVLTVKQVIDRETTPAFQFILIATDGGTPSRSSNVSIRFTVEDLNDNWPVYTSSFYSYGIPYNDNCNSKVGKVTATDSDDADVVTYHLTTTEYLNVFSLNSSSGVITLVSVPLKNAIYELYITAFDTALHNDTTKVRVYTFESEATVVTLVLGISKDLFSSLEQTFVSLLDSVFKKNYTNSQTHIYCIKRTSDSSIDVSIYVVMDTGTNYKRMLASNNFLSPTIIKSLLTARDGSLWDQFNITGVTSFIATVPISSSDEKWIESTTGIAVISTIAALLVIGTLLTILLVKLFRTPKVLSEVEKIKAKRQALKVEEDELTKPPEIKRQAMQIDADELDDNGALSRTNNRTGTAQSNKTSRTQLSKQRLFTHKMSVPGVKGDLKVETDEIDKSKLPPPVIVRGPITKIDRKTNYRENDFWNDISMIPPNAININEANRRNPDVRQNKVDRPLRFFDPVSGKVVELDAQTSTKRFITKDEK